VLLSLCSSLPAQKKQKNYKTKQQPQNKTKQTEIEQIDLRTRWGNQVLSSDLSLAVDAQLSSAVQLLYEGIDEEYDVHYEEGDPYPLVESEANRDEDQETQEEDEQ